MESVYPYRKAILLGAGGFIGINLAQKLASCGLDIVCFNRSPCEFWPSGTRTIIGDFNSPPSELLAALDDCVIFHLVSSGRPSSNTMRAADEACWDIGGTVKLLELTKGRRIRWVFLSSGGTVYGQNDDEQIIETSCLKPICSYGVVKLSIEQYYSLYHTLYGTDYTVIRLANPYGPWQYPLTGQGLIAALLYSTLTEAPIQIWGDGENIRDYIYIDDAISGIMLAATQGGTDQIYNLGSGSGNSINELIKAIGQNLGIEPLVEYLPSRAVDVRRNVLNYEKFTLHTGWRPTISFTEGLNKTAAWLCKQYGIGPHKL